MMFMHYRGAVARLALVALVVTVLAPAARAQASASLAGRVFAADGRTPRSGVTVSLVDDEGSRAKRSEPTTTEGSFVIADAAPGHYRLLVEAPEGAFLAPTGVDVATGVNRPLALALAPGADYQTSSSNPSGSTGGLPVWAQWVIAGGIVVTSLVVINAINDDDEPASDF